MIRMSSCLFPFTLSFGCVLMRPDRLPWPNNCNKVESAVKSFPRSRRFVLTHKCCGFSSVSSSFSSWPESSTSSRRENLSGERPEARQETSRCSQSRGKIRQKITAKEEKRRKRQKTESRESCGLACSGCYKPEGRDRRRRRRKKKTCREKNEWINK